MTLFRSVIVGIILMCIALPGSSIRAQELLLPYISGTTGADAQVYSFGTGVAVRSIRQIAVPLGVVVPVGRRLTLDFGTSYAWTEVELSDGTRQDITSLTDTQIRAAYLIGRDAAVVSLMVNLPTGAEQTTLTEFSAASAVSTNFLPFPVHTYGTGAAVTGGVALARPVGAWNVGLAGSVRVNGSYQPFSDAPGLEYRQGLEGRLRLGVDRLIGRSRLTFGATFGTFGDDEFSDASGGALGQYQPGNRVIGEVVLTSPLGGGSVTAFLWDFYRSAGTDQVSGTVSNRENILAAGAQGAWRLGSWVSLIPSVEGRLWSPDRGHGWLAIAGLSVPLHLSRVLSLVPEGRVDIGSMDRTGGGTANITGFGISLFVRGSF